MRYQQHLFYLCHVFDSSHRDRAYEMACEFERNGIKTAITLSGKGYRLWATLWGAILLTERVNSQGHDYQSTLGRIASLVSASLVSASLVSASAVPTKFQLHLV